MHDFITYLEEHNGLVQVIIAGFGLIITVIQLSYAITAIVRGIVKNFKIRNMVRKIKAVEPIKFDILIETGDNSKDKSNERAELYFSSLTGNGALAEENKAPSKKDVQVEFYCENTIPVKHYYENCKDDIETIKSLYRGLLAFESEFSMSYGFGRYIDFFREAIPQLEEKYSRIQTETKENEMRALYEYRLSMEVYLQELRAKFRLHYSDK